MSLLCCICQSRARRAVAVLFVVIVGCRGDLATTPLTPVTTPPLGAGAPSVSATFELLGGYRLASDYASEGLALVTDAEGFVVEAVAGAHAQTGSVHLFDLRRPYGTGDSASAYPVLTPLRTWSVAALFPRWIPGQSLRDVAINSSATGYELAGIGRVFYNTAPRSSTQINVREIRADGVFGATREIPITLPEQEFSGFIKHEDRRRDFDAIGAGAYDSGQGSVAGLSYARRDSAGNWTRLLTPPGFGDLSSPRLPRDAGYSCSDGLSWVCIPPVNATGVWSTERIGGGGVRFGSVVMFIATLGYGERSYARQSYTFGDPALDRAVAYFFVHRPDSTVQFLGYDRWTAAAGGEPVIGVALGRVPGINGTLLFVVKANAWGEGATRAAPALQLFRIR